MADMERESAEFSTDKLDEVREYLRTALSRCQELFFQESLVEAGDWARRGLAEVFRSHESILSKCAPEAADAALWLARIGRRAGQPAEALRWAETVLSWALTNGDPKRECLAQFHRTRILNDLGETAEAMTAADAARRAALRAKDSTAECAALEAQADLHWTFSQWDAALATYARMLVLAEAAHDLEFEAVAHGGLGAVNQFQGTVAGEAGDPVGAARHFQVAADEAAAYLRCAEAVGDCGAVRVATHNNAIAQLGQGNTNAARQCLEKLLNAKGAENLTGNALLLMNLGEVEFREGNLAKARLRIQQALELNDKNENLHDSMSCCELMVPVCEAAGDLLSALAFHRRYHALYVQVASKEVQMRASAMEFQFETHKANALAEELRARADELTASHESLLAEAERLTHLSLEDALTKVGNRRRFDMALNAALAKPFGSRSFSLALVDIDHFKRVNDRWSHMVGDAVLQRVGAVLAEQSRGGDVVARFGGEEFALIIHDVDREEAARSCERIRRAIELESLDDIREGLRITISIGLAHSSECETSVGFLAVVDRRLYLAKNGGRNQVRAIGGLDAPIENS